MNNILQDVVIISLDKYHNLLAASNNMATIRMTIGNGDSFMIQEGNGTSLALRRPSYVVVNDRDEIIKALKDEIVSLHDQITKK